MREPFHMVFNYNDYNFKRGSEDVNIFPEEIGGFNFKA